MKKFLLLSLISVLSFACSDEVESNTPVIQGSVNNQFFRAPRATAMLNADGSVKITGIKDSRTITLQISSPELGQYPLGENIINQATFLDFDQNLYTAGAGSGDGMIEITEYTGASLSGIFYFNALNPGMEEALNFQKGVFFEVPIINGAPTEGEETGSTFSADIAGTPFVADQVSAQNLGGNLTLIGLKQTTTISLIFATDIAPGDYALIATGFPTAKYVVNFTTEVSETGTLTIISNDTTTKTVKGTFKFTTSGSQTAITNGAFTASYQ